MNIHINKFLINLSYLFTLIGLSGRMLLKLNNSIQLSMICYGSLLMAVILQVVYLLLIAFKKIIKIDINLFIFFFIIYQLVVSLFNSSIYFPYGIIDIMLWPLTIMTFYDYLSRNELPNLIKKSVIFFYFIFIFISISLISVHLAGNGNMGGVIFPVYLCLTFLPFVMKNCKKLWVRKLCIIICLAIIIASTKRTGTLALILGVFTYLFSDAYVQNKSSQRIKRYFKLFFIIIIAFIGITILINTSDLAIIERFSKLSSDGGSGRDKIWAFVIDAFKNSNIIYQIFGHGYNSVYYSLRPFGFYRMAHNSYIEYLYDFGIVGTAMLLIYIIWIIKKAIKFLREKNKNAPYICYSIMLILMLSMFSYFFEESFIIVPIAMLLGECFGENVKERRQNENL